VAPRDQNVLVHRSGPRAPLAIFFTVMIIVAVYDAKIVS
jgi:hypothetical protein